MNTLTVQGGEESFTIHQGKGQGQTNVGQEAAFTMSVVNNRNQDLLCKPLIYKDINCRSSEFVDDTFNAAKTAEESVVNGKVVTVTLDELALSAHPDKSKMIITGGEDYVTKTRNDMASNPTVIQGHIIKESCLLYTSPSPRDKRQSRMPSSA